MNAENAANWSIVDFHHHITETIHLSYPPAISTLERYYFFESLATSRDVAVLAQALRCEGMIISAFDQLAGSCDSLGIYSLLCSSICNHALGKHEFANAIANYAWTIVKNEYAFKGSPLLAQLEAEDSIPYTKPPWQYEDFFPTEILGDLCMLMNQPTLAESYYEIAVQADQQLDDEEHYAYTLMNISPDWEYYRSTMVWTLQACSTCEHLIEDLPLEFGARIEIKRTILKSIIGC
jgi:hypothetical protein